MFAARLLDGALGDPGDELQRVATEGGELGELLDVLSENGEGQMLDPLPIGLRLTKPDDSARVE